MEKLQPLLAPGFLGWGSANSLSFCSQPHLNNQQNTAWCSSEGRASAGEQDLAAEGLAWLHLAALLVGHLKGQGQTLVLEVPAALEQTLLMGAVSLQLHFSTAEVNHNSVTPPTLSTELLMCICAAPEPKARVTRAVVSAWLDAAAASYSSASTGKKHSPSPTQHIPCTTMGG